MAALPDDALRAVARIEALLDEANRLIERNGIADETAFSLQETERRYLPDTVAAYRNVPASLRDAAADALFIDQLHLLERATSQRLSALAQSAGTALAANGAFLAERFADSSGAAPVVQPPHAAADVQELGAPRALVARLFADLPVAGGADPARLLQAAAQRLGAIFPTLTTVRRGLFGGPVKSFWLDVPVGADTLRYTLESDRGGVAATCTKIVRGVALRTERVDLGVWLVALREDVGSYVERDRSARDVLTRFLEG